MDISVILVHMDSSQRVYQRLHLASQLALECRATLVGLLAVGMAEAGPKQLLGNEARYVAACQHRQARSSEYAWHAFNAATESLDIATEWLAPNLADGATLQAEAHRADLVVIGQEDPEDEHAYSRRHFVESTLARCGRPILVVPHAGWFPTVGRRALVAWNGSHQSARALRDALPLLQRADTVDIVTYARPHVIRDPWCSPPQYARDWLARHGVQARHDERMVRKDEDVAQLLLSAAADQNADLLVAGAYSRGRMREMVLGGTTQALLHTMTVPTLFSC
ncbi:Nucleotide-binding universal stress protein, UspA family [Cupriavidus sp. YR651]|uniref:universal stress protein n=1 Tax=Cupriavidus sp. YR651 TaxID=1855315 RepID=UPI00088D5249|nr:universal stress protein [Cupriavidus sp. YR651]SDD82721.1 Nucleotide-binding universal stress protein, UspA family [Cupriavidus sp. YR651]